MRRYELTTPYGDRYFIHDNGNIERTDIPSFACSGQWKLVAIVDALHGGIVARFDNLSQWLARSPEMRFKNRNPRFTVMDFDHGTNRIWGNTKYHGIAGIREL